MGNTSKALRKAEKKYHKKKRQTAVESENKSTRFKIVFIGLLALVTLFLNILVYFSFQGRHNAIVPDLNDLKSAKARIAEFEKVAAMREQPLSKLEKKLKKLQSNLDKEKESKSRLRVLLLSKVAVVDELKEKLKISQSDHLSLKDEITKSNEQIRELQTQVANLEKEKPLAEATLKVVRRKISQPQTASSVILQKNAEPRNFNLQADALTLTSETTDASMTIPFKEKASQKMQEPSDDLSISVRSSQDTDLTNSTKPTATSESGALREEAESPDPTAIIDWLIRNHSK